MLRSASIAGMANLASAENPVVSRSYDFGKFGRIVDVGGGRGGLLAEILKAYPSLKAVLFDQPQVVANPEYLRVAGVLDRCELVGGNFFESVPEGADAYVLKRIIHDWNDDRSVSILRNCRDAVVDGGRVIVVDAVVAAGNEFHSSKLMDLLMMVLLNGRERTEADFFDEVKPEQTIFRAAVAGPLYSCAKKFLVGDKKATLDAIVRREPWNAFRVGCVGYYSFAL